MIKEIIIFEPYKHKVFITEAIKDGEHSHYILYRKTDGCFMKVAESKDLDSLKKRTKEEYFKTRYY